MPVVLFASRIAVPLMALGLSACASFSDDGGLSVVSDNVTAARIFPVALKTDEASLAARDEMDRILKKIITADDAVRIAMLNNKELQAAYNALGLAEAARVQASLPPNPTFSIERIATSGTVELEARAVASILALATLPARAEIASDRYRQAQLQAAEATLRVAAEARRAWFEAVASRSMAGFLAQAQTTSNDAARLSQRLGEAGTLNKLDQARNQVFFAELTAQLASARQQADRARERLVRALGLWGADLNFRLPASLPALPRPLLAAAVETEAVGRRLDLQVARIEVSALAKAHGLTSATRFINLLDVTGIKRSEKDGEQKTAARGYEVEFQIPIFDFGTVRARQAEETYMQAVNRLIAKAVNVRSEAREAYRSYRAAHDIARHYRNEVLPLRKIISDETLLRYNAMQIDVFALLTEARQRITSISASISAERDFWIAQTNLGTAILGGGGAADMSGAIAQSAAEPAGH